MLGFVFWKSRVYSSDTKVRNVADKSALLKIRA